MPGGPIPRRRVASRVAVVVLAAVGAAQWLGGVAPLATLVAGYVALAAALSRALPVRLALPAAFLIQNAVYLALVLVHPLVTSGPIRPGAALAMLTVPCAALLVDVVAQRRDAPVTGSATGARALVPLVAAAAVGGVLMVLAVLWAGRDDPFGYVAWNSSGDARFHLLFVRDVLTEGGLHGRPFTYQPQYQEALTGLLVDTHGRGRLAPGPRLEHDLQLMAQVSVALTVMWSLACSAMLLGFGRLRGKASAAVLVVASLLPLTGIALGVVLRDGFLPILLLVPLLLTTVTLLCRLATATEDTEGSDDTENPEDTERLSGRAVTWLVAVTALALPVLAFTWTPFAVVAGCAALPAWWSAVRHVGGRTRGIRVALMAGGALTSAAYTVVVFTNARDFVLINGSIAAPAPPTTLLVPLVVLLIAIGRWSAVPTRALVPYFVGTVATAAISVYAMVLQPPGVMWGYFPSKIPWIWTLVGLTLLLLPFAHLPRRSAVERSRPLVVAGSVGVLLTASALAPMTSPVLPADVGWVQSGPAPTKNLSHWTLPTPVSLRLAVSLGHRVERYVVYHVSPPDDRLTNFWLSLYDSLDDREFFHWTYLGGVLADVCALHALQPDRIVVTADPTTPDQLAQQCGLTDVRVMLLPADHPAVTFGEPVG